ncbi:hypothetical protein OsJ_17578 [Oryza sativa Japonica Group]|uniref:Transcription repressor n=1 Tax=Oryza sativa subsp. japonica TaxID=39947 RepID=B9FN56_ORYSJ|nr:hypothetical protein OsJ_17578 [Oryza sativa Japonica Group]
MDDGAKSGGGGGGRTKRLKDRLARLLLLRSPRSCRPTPTGFTTSDDDGEGADGDDDDDDNDGTEAFFSSRSLVSSDSSGFYACSSKQQLLPHKSKANRHRHHRRHRQQKPTTTRRRRRRASGCVDDACSVRDAAAFRPLVSTTAEEEVRKGLAVVKRSSDPYGDFRESMAEMIVERQVFAAAELERLLRSYLSLNPPRLHPVILQAFSDIWVVSPRRLAS